MDGPPKDSSVACTVRELMISTNIAVKHHAQDFLFVLCDEDAHRFARVTGLGFGAGLLQEKNMLGLFQQLVKNNKTEENPNISNYDDDESDEEDAQDLQNKLNRLQELGFISTVHK